MDKKDPHSFSERQDDGPIDHEMRHKFDPTDDYGSSIRSRGLRRLKEAEERQNTNNAGAALSNSENLPDLEAQGGGWRSNVTPKNSSTKNGGSSKKEAFLQGFKKKGLPVTGILGIVIGLILGGGFFGATLAPFMFLHNSHLDLSDITSINQRRTADQIAEKFDKTKTGTDQVTLGCKSLGSILPLKCKLKSVSPWLEDKLKGVGIEIEGTHKFGGRVVPERYIDTRTGKTYNAEQFTAAMKGSDPELWGRYHRAINSNWLAYKGKTFINGVLKKFGVSERPVDLGEGDYDEKKKRFMSGAGAQGSVDAPTFTKTTVTDEATGETREVWVDDATGEVVDEATKDARIAAAEPVSGNTKPRTQMAVGVAEKVGFGLNVLGWADAACTTRNLIGQGSITAKVNNAEQLARYAGAILPSVSKLQASHVDDPIEAQIIQETFVETDARKTVTGFEEANPGDENTLTAELESGDEVAIKTAEITNPDYGKNAMDSELYKMSAGGGVAYLSESERNYSLGIGPETLFTALASGAFNILDFATTVRDVDNCEFVQSNVGRIIGIAGGAFISIAGIVSSVAGVGVVVLAGQAAKAAATIIAFTAASMLLTRWINSAYTDSLISDSIDQAPVERGAALWTGIAVLTSANAQMRGMMPASSEEIVAYQQEQRVANQKYIALQRQESDPLDIRNPYSLTGTIAYEIADHIPNELSATSLASIPTGVSSLVLDGFSSALSPAAASAATLDPERFKQCDDEGYKDVGIDADVQCNVRYVMPNESVQWSPLEAAQLMEDRKFVEPNTTTGYPQGYTPPQPEKIQEGAMNMIKGEAENFIEGIAKLVYNTEKYENKYNEEKTPDSPNGAKYAKFLDYCVYRALPFGKTYEDDDADKAVGSEWLDGSKCRDTSDEDINLFRIYVFDMSVNDDLDGPIQEPYCAPSNLSPGSALGKATAGEIDAAIEASEKANPDNPHPLHGKGAAIIELSNEYGVNSDLIAVTLLAETQFGADGSIGPRYNNFGYNKLNEFNECEPFTVGTTGEYNCYLTPEAGIEGILKNLTGNPDYRTEIDPTAPPGTKPNTIASVRTIYCPEGDGDCNLNNFLKMGEAINIPIKADDPVFGTASSPGTGGSPSPARSDSVKLSQTDLERKIATYGLPAPQASGESGYDALAKKLKEDPNALWSAQSFLTGEKNAAAKGFDIKQYLTTAWVWFETGAYPDLYEVNCMSNTSHPTNETCRIGESPDKVQVAGYQAWDVSNKLTEVYNKLYTESELQAIMEKVIDNSSKASIEPWKYQESDKEKVKGVTLADVYPAGDRDYGVFNDDKRQFLSFVLGKDPNMAAALNSFAVSDDDVIKHISGPGCGPGWASYICDDDKQLISNMMMALLLIDDGSLTSGEVQCQGTSPNRGSGEGIEAVWGGEGEKDLSYGFGVEGVADWYGYGRAYGTSGTTHTATDIPMDPYAPVYSPVEGVVVCERNGSGDGLPGIGCAGSNDYSLTGEYGCSGEPGKPGGAGTILIQITKNGVPTGDALRLGHLAESLVKNGDKVTPNQQVGLAGCMNGWHTHVEYFIPAPGVTSSGVKLVDPVKYLAGEGDE